jgi:hypothetical protein
VKPVASKRLEAIVIASIALCGVQASYAGRFAEEAVQPVTRCGFVSNQGAPFVTRSALFSGIFAAGPARGDHELADELESIF